MSSPPASALPPGQAASVSSVDQSTPFIQSVRERFHNLPRWAKFAMAALVLVVIVAWFVWAGRVSTDDAQVDAHVTTMASQVSGYVVTLMIDDNVDVKTGDVLLQIDPREYRAQVDQ